MFRTFTISTALIASQAFGAKIIEDEPMYDQMNPCKLYKKYGSRDGNDTMSFKEFRKAIKSLEPKKKQLGKEFEKMDLDENE